MVKRCSAAGGETRDWIVKSEQRLLIYYDGECPFCSRYVQYYRLHDGNTMVRILNARTLPDKVREFRARGLDLDQGMVVELNGATYSGSEAVHVLALLSSSSGTFNRLNRWIFSRRRLAQIVYPLLVRGRNATLWFLRRKKLDLL